MRERERQRERERERGRGSERERERDSERERERKGERVREKERERERKRERKRERDSSAVSSSRFQVDPSSKISALKRDGTDAVKALLRVEFLLKTDSGDPRDAEVTLFTLANPEHSLRFNTHWSAPPVSALARPVSLASKNKLIKNNSRFLRVVVSFPAIFPFPATKIT